MDREKTPREIDSDTRQDTGRGRTDTHPEDPKKAKGNDPEAGPRRVRPETEEGPRAPQRPSCADKDSEDNRHPGSKADTKIQSKAKSQGETPRR